MSLRNLPKEAGHGTGQISPKTEGYVVQSIRMTVDDNNKVRKAAEKAGLSINSWAVSVLRDAAYVVNKRKKASKNGKAGS